MLKYLVAEYIMDKKNLDAVVKLMKEFYRSDVRIGNEEKKVKDALMNLGELEILKQFEKGMFSGAV